MLIRNVQNRGQLLAVLKQCYVSGVERGYSSLGTCYALSYPTSRYRLCDRTKFPCTIFVGDEELRIHIDNDAKDTTGHRIPREEDRVIMDELDIEDWFDLFYDL